jgi:Asp-tRNA(Asn)/Glu-tRNA(Gln) amidotransferase A subunit family amidase
MPNTIPSDPGVETRRRFLAYFTSVGLSSTLLPGVLWSQVSDPHAPRITLDMLKYAETIAGLHFTDEQRGFLLSDVNQSLDRFEKMRTIPLPNSVPSSLRFSPIVSGMKFDTIPRPMIMSKAPEVQRPADLEEVAFWPVTMLAPLIQSRQVTSVELTKMYLARLKRYNDKLKFVITFTDELAMKQARQADAEIAAGHYRGPLHGIPWGAKDLIAKKGYTTTWGAAPYKDQIFDYDAPIMTRLEDAGAVLVAKLVSGEIAAGDTWFGGQTRNPWNPAEGSGGSSAGPASATSSGCVGFAIGTETGGSIVGPSTRCAVYGLRPTYGRVSRHGVMALAWSLDKAGPLCRSVEDCAIILNALQGPDDLDLTVTTLPFNWNSELDITKLRVGYLKAAFDEPRATKEEKANDAATLDKLRSMGVTLKPIEYPDYPIQDLLALMYTEFSAAMDDLTRSNRADLLVRQGANSQANLYRKNRYVPAVEYIQASRVRTLLMEDMARIMKDVDVYLAPISASHGPGPGGPPPQPPAARETPNLVGLNTTLTNLTGHPGIVVRNGLGADGKPTSITFIGSIYGEAQMLSLAHAYQTATEWHLKHPTLS